MHSGNLRGISPASVAGSFHMVLSYHQLMPALARTIAHTLPAQRGRTVPSSFDALDPALGALPLPEGYTWHTAARTLASLSSEGVMMRLPLFWQTELLLHEACRTASTFLFVNDRKNVPVGVLAVKQRVVDTIVTDFEDASAFIASLTDAAVPIPKKWILVRRPDQARITLPLRPKLAHIAEEIHLVPGMPLLTQCETLAATDEPVFHAADVLNLTIADTGCSVSAPEQFWSLHDHPLPFAARQSGVCSCGKEKLAIV